MTTTVYGGRDLQSPFSSPIERPNHRNLWHSRPLDVHRWSDHPEVHSLIEHLWTEYFSDFETDTAIQGRRPKGHPKRQLRVLILDLYVAWRDDPTLSIGVSMSNSGYRPSSRYNALHISKVIIDLVRRANEVGLIGFAPGSESAERNSRIWAEYPLIDLFMRAKFSPLDIGHYAERETIVLSKGKGRLLQYDDTPEIIGQRLKMQAYNDLMRMTFVDLPVLEEPVIQIPAATSYGQPTNLHVSQNNKFSTRVHYRGDWGLGGRVHGGLWQPMPKVWRPHLFINDLPTVEEDYSGLHMALLYGMEGKALEGDAYTLDLPTTFASGDMRELVKSLALMAINAKSEVKAFQAFRQDQPAGSAFKRLTNKQLSVVLSAFKERHPAIARYMCSDRGVHLMAIDGRITMRIIDLFTREKVPLLTLFDSYVVDTFHAGELRSAMHEALHAEVPGASTTLKRIGFGYDDLLKQADGDILELFKLPQRLLSRVVKTRGYQSRREAFKHWRYEQPEWKDDALRIDGMDQIIKWM